MLRGRLRVGYSCPREGKRRSAEAKPCLLAPLRCFLQSEHDTVLYIMLSWVEKNIPSSSYIAISHGTIICCSGLVTDSRSTSTPTNKTERFVVGELTRGHDAGLGLRIIVEELDEVLLWIMLALHDGRRINAFGFESGATRADKGI